jgi:hypothetical protein
VRELLKEEVRELLKGEVRELLKEEVRELLKEEVREGTEGATGSLCSSGPWRRRVD